MVVYILDSNSKCRDQMLHWLEEDASVERTEVFEDYNRLIEQAELFIPDLCIIRLGAFGIPGFLAARLLQQKCTDIRIVFVSDDRDYVIEAYEVGAGGYLLCPLNRDKFNKNIFHYNRKPEGCNDKVI